MNMMNMMNNKDNYMNHLYEELLDAAQYIKKEQSIIPDIQKLINECPNNMELEIGRAHV